MEENSDHICDDIDHYDTNEIIQARNEKMVSVSISHEDLLPFYNNEKYYLSELINIRYKYAYRQKLYNFCINEVVEDDPNLVHISFKNLEVVIKDKIEELNKKLQSLAKIKNDYENNL